jgi:glycosyltransferase involved in cell wall biosynthesis
VRYQTPPSADLAATETFREGEAPCKPSANAGLDGPSPSQGRLRGSHRVTHKTPVSVMIPVKNEAENLKRCLPALAWADEIFVIDSQSSDQTSEVAMSFGAEVVQFHFNGKYPKKKNWALDNLPFRNEWVMIVDADEVVIPELANEIADRIARGEADGYYLNSRYYFLGRHIRHCGYSSCWNLRLFIHRLGRYEKIPDGTGGRAGDNEAHEHVELDGRVLRLSHELEHHAYPTVAVWVEKHNRYAIWEAALADRVIHEPIPKTIGGVQRFKRRLKKIAWRLPMRPLVRFLYAYVLRLGFLDGKPGLYFCGLLAFYDFLALVNRYEMGLVEATEASGVGAE